MNVKEKKLLGGARNKCDEVINREKFTVIQNFQ